MNTKTIKNKSEHVKDRIDCPFKSMLRGDRVPRLAQKASLKINKHQDFYFNKNMFGTFKTIVVDPPWNQGKTGKRKVRPNQATRLNYPTLSKQDLVKLPIKKLCAKDCYLFLWATNSKDRKTGEPILKMAFDLIEQWGFKFHTMITWNKKTGPCPFGPFQIVTEYVLFAYKGKSKFNKRRLGYMKNIFPEAPSGHSIKPQVFYDAITKISRAPRLDVFARQKRTGFQGWGNEYPIQSANKILSKGA